jgi:imidazolonepropionase-like amidohydrolase
MSPAFKSWSDPISLIGRLFQASICTMNFVESGFTPMEAIRTATAKPAEFLGQLHSLGTIEKGEIADMVPLDANPLEDINHTRKINSVVLGGKLIPIAALSAEVLRDAGLRALKHKRQRK